LPRLADPRISRFEPGECQSEWAQSVSDAGVGAATVEPGRDWIWREDRVRALLSREDADLLFLGGCAENMRGFLPRFDHVVLLRAPAAVIVERLATRTSNAYGKHPEEVKRVLNLIETVEPLLRRAAGHEIDASAPLDDVVATVLRIAASE
jgi:shikimate kinase